MILATTFGERFADMLERVICFFIGSALSGKGTKLVLFLHSRREFVVIKKPLHTSYSYHNDHGGVEYVPEGEHMTLYFWRGYVYRFWNGKCTSVDTALDYGYPDGYSRDSSKYPSVWNNYLKKKKGGA